MAAISAGGADTVVLKQDGTVVAWGLNTTGQSTVPAGLSGVAAISASSIHTVALKQDGTIVAWGANNAGQTTVPAGLNGVVAISTGVYHTVALKQDGTVVAWGDNSNGQTTVPAGLSGVATISAGGYHTTALKQDGTVVAWGRTYEGQTTVPAGLGGVAAISAGLYQTVALYDTSRDTAPAIFQQPTSKIANLDDGVAFSVSASPLFPGLSYQWRKNGTSISGTTTSTFSIAKATSADAGSYDVLVSNYLGTVTSFPATLTMNPAAPAGITIQPSDITANAGASVTLSFTASGNPTPAYQWYKDGALIIGASSNSYAIAAVATTNAGMYTATATNTYAGAQYKLTTNPAVLIVTAVPSITTQPSALTVTAGNVATLTVTATGSPAPSYQWYKNDVAIAGATGSTLSLNSVTKNDAATYSVTVSNSFGTATSSSVALTVNPSSALSNLSVRATMASGQILLVGAVISGGSKNVLVRAGGPVLTKFGLTGMIDPRLELYTNGSLPVAANDDWPSSLATIFTSVGAFAYDAGSRDAALSQSLNGAFTVQAEGTGPGTILVETYDVAGGTSTRLINLSARNKAGAGDDILIAGFAISGTGTMQVLIRAIGPTLAAFAVSGTLADPRLQVLDSRGAITASNDNWDQSLSFSFAQVGAFPLTIGSKDAALLLTLNAGATYTVQVSGADGGTGEALVEIYELP